MWYIFVLPIALFLLVVLNTAVTIFFENLYNIYSETWNWRCLSLPIPTRANCPP